MPNSGKPVPIRRDTSSHNDPYTRAVVRHGAMVCQDCGAVYKDRRWALPKASASQREAVPYKALTPAPVVCPACHRIRDDVPAGVVVLAGAFLEHHEEEIIRLIVHESDRAMKLNPLSRVMHIAPQVDGIVEVHTTSDKLAQQIGKALHKAYDGEVTYRFVQDTKLARVTWERTE